MPNTPRASIRSIAAITGLSKATVANALNGTPTVAKATATRVLEAAEKAGYQRNPMVGSLMSAMRRSQGSQLKGVLAVAEITEPDRPEHGLFNRKLLEGCKRCADELGFKIEFFRVGIDGLSPERLSGVLKARGIRGLILMPSWRLPDFARFDWEWFTGIYADYIPEVPTLNTVCCDHYRSMLGLLQQIRARGYTRPGLVLEQGRDERIHLRLNAAIRAFQASHGEPCVTPLISTRFDATQLVHWLEAEQPDVVLSHHLNILDWIVSSGRQVPDHTGFVSLNLSKTSRPCAGLDLHPEEIGRCAVENLIGQVQRRAWGRPRTPTNTTVMGSFIDGPTLRSPDQVNSLTPG